MDLFVLPGSQFPSWMVILWIFAFCLCEELLLLPRQSYSSSSFLLDSSMSDRFGQFLPSPLALFCQSLKPSSPKSSVVLKYMVLHHLMQKLQTSTWLNETPYTSPVKHWWCTSILFGLYISVLLSLVIWGFPEIGLPPGHHPLLDGIFHEINHP